MKWLKMTLVLTVIERIVMLARPADIRAGLVSSRFVS
jgi:hypothetical protein